MSNPLQSNPSFNESLHRYFLQMQGGRLYPDSVPMNEFQRVIDVECGAGEWIFDLAKRYPKLHIYGLDSNEQLLHQARVRRSMSSLSQIELRQMNLSHGLSLPDNAVDFIHMRRVSRFMGPHAWHKVFRDGIRVLRPGGWITIVELELCEISSPACQMLYHSILKAQATLGYTLDESGLSFGMAQRLYALLLREPLDEVNYDLHTLDLGFQGGSVAHLLLEDLLCQASIVKPLVVQQGMLTASEFDTLLIDAHEELEDPMLCGWALLVSAYGRKVL